MYRLQNLDLGFRVYRVCAVAFGLWDLDFGLYGCYSSGFETQGFRFRGH